MASPAEAAGKPGTSQPRDPGSVPAGLEKSDWSSIRAAYEAGRHEIRATADGHEARNPGLGWRTTWDGRGFLAQPASAGDGAWQWGLQLESYGFPGAEQLVSGTTPAHTEGQRLTYQWDGNVQEWYVNDQRGVEHGFTVAARPVEKDQKDERDQKDSAATSLPSFESLLSFTMNVRGGLHPAISPDAQTVRFLDAAGAAVVTYGGLKVWDADGKVLPAHFGKAESAADSFRLLVDERGARYPLTVDPVAQQAYLKPDAVGTTQDEDQFGRSLAISGNTVVIAAPYEDSDTIGVGSIPNELAQSAGAAYVFVRNGAGGWTQQAYLKASNSEAFDYFGESVAISGNTIVVGASREASNATGVNAAVRGGSGTQADDSAPGAGAAYVFVRNEAGAWIQQAYLKASNTGVGDSFGRSVAISGDTIVVAAYGEASNATGVNAAVSGDSGTQADDSFSGAGAAYVFVRNEAGAWMQQAYLKASHSAAADYFGNSVAISGNTIVVGAHAEDSNATGINADVSGGSGTQADNSEQSAGAAYAFIRASDGSGWSQQAYLKASNTGAADQFGISVAISGDTIVVGANREASDATGVNAAVSGGSGTQADNGTIGAGATYVFVRNEAGAWMQQAYLKASNSGRGDFFGNSVAISGDTIVVGAYGEASNTTGVNADVSGGSGTQADNSTRNAGATYLFTRSAAIWSQQAYLKPSNAGAGDAFGFSVAISGDTIVVGAPVEESSSTGTTSTSNNSASNAGAAYTFLFRPTIPQILTRPATAISATAATLNCRAFPNYSATTVEYEWGESPMGTLTTVTLLGTFSGSAPVFPTHPLIGLLPGREYRFRAKASNGVGPAILDSFLTFTTAPAAPTVTTFPASSVTHTSASLDGTVSANGASTTVTFTYTGPDGVPHTLAASPSPVTTADTPVAVDLTGLLVPETTYRFYATAANPLGTVASTPVRTFTTPSDPAVVGGLEPLNPVIAGGLLFGSVVQPDGGTLLFGAFNSVNSTTRNRIARLKPDGSLDMAFNPNADGPVVCAAVLNDGKIFIGGNFNKLQPGGPGNAISNRSRLARLNADGTVDLTFDDPLVSHFVLSLAVQADGAVLVGGDFFAPVGVTNFMGATRNRIARITPAGVLDTGFDPNAGASVYAIAPLTDGSGSVLLGGAFTTMRGSSRNFLAKVNGTTGALLTYSGVPSGTVYSIALQRDGKALIGGLFTTMNTTARNRLARLETSGALDMGFDPNVNGEVRSLAVQTNGKILLGGNFTTVNGSTPRNKLARLSSAGVADAFDPNAGVGEVFGVSLQKDGRVLAAGNFTTMGGTGRPGFALLSNETAFETLEKRSDTFIRLNRAASAPLASSVTFEKSTDSGATWSALGTVRSTIATPDFILTGISPPLPPSARLRARARTAGGYYSGSAGLTETVLDYSHPKPTVTAVSATDITATSAVFRSMVNANGYTTDVFYNYSVNPAPYDRTVSGATVTGSVAGAADLAVYGLLPGTTYHFECVAVNLGGTTTVTGVNFTTLSNLHVDYSAVGPDTAPTVSSYTAWGRQVSFSLFRPLAPGTTLMVVNNTGTAPIEGTFANLAQGQAVDLTYLGVTYPFVAHYYGGTGNDLVLLWRNTRALSWGWNNLSQLGSGNSTNRGIPGDVVPFDLLAGKTIVSLSGGTHHSVALCVDGTLATWGDNLEGQLGNGDILARYSSVPTAVEQGFLPAGIHPVAVSAGGSHTLTLFSDGKVYAWGDNEYGQVGNGSSGFDENLPAPTAGVLSGRRVIGISAGESHSLAVCDDGFVAAWGLGDSGQLGNGDTANQKSPVAVDLFNFPLDEKIVAVAAGRWHSMALTSGGKVFTWGRNTEGQLGDGTTNGSKYPVLVPKLTATAIYGGGTMHSLALRNDGKLVAWGSNTFGQLGTGAFADSYTPTGMKNTWLSGQSLGSAVAGDGHNLALRGDGTLYAWGLGNEGRLGDNDTGIHTQPLPLPVDATALDPGDRWLSFASGAACQHSLAIVAMSLQPAVTTYAATPWSATEASLFGIVRAHGVPVNVSFDYGLTSAYGTTVTASPAAMNGTTPAYAEAGISGLLPGTTYHYQVKAAQGGSFIAFGGDRTFTTYSRLQMWRNDWFGTIENTGEAADSADPDNDDINNLLEFAFSLNPQQNSQGQLPGPQLFPGSVQYAFAEPDSSMGLTYGAEWSPDMTPGSWTAIPDLAASPNHLFKLATGALDRVFVRLTVTPVAP